MKENVHIEGLDYTQDHDLLDDTPPDSIITTFQVVSEVMPYASNLAGAEVRQNFIHVSRVFELGKSSYTRRIRDNVEYDEKLGKWVIKRLAVGGQSDIKKNPNEWNAFMRGVVSTPIGAPISILFKNDPSRVAFYESNHIHTIEQMALLNHTDRTSLGMGVADDCRRAEAYLEKVKASAPAAELAAKMDEKDQQIALLQRKIEEMSSVMDAKLEKVLETKSRGRPKQLEAE